MNYYESKAKLFILGAQILVDGEDIMVGRDKQDELRGYFMRSDKKNWNNIYGRENERRVLESFLRSNRPIIVKGFRRVGKTSFLYGALTDIYGKDNVIFKKVKRNTSLSDIIEELKQKTDFNKSILVPASYSESKSVGFGLTNLGVNAEGTKSYKAIDDVDKLLSKIRGKFVIVLDEFQRIEDLSEFENFIEDVFKSHGEKIRIILTGSEVSLVEEKLRKFPVKPNYMTLYPLQPDDAVEFIKEGFNQNEYKITEKQAKDFYSKIGGIPGAVIEFAEHIILNSDLSDIDEAIEKAINEVERSIFDYNLDKEFEKIENLFDADPEIAYKPIWHLKWNKWKLSSGEMMKRLSSSEIAKMSLKKLVEYGYIYYDEKTKTYQIFDPLLQKYFEQKLSGGRK
ncbi:ATP-binding protein [Thermococcus sp. LS2]|uniref:AAA family ATPase n=1 Tax=Thermococcus sp. LS2 TaxID=1638260 RepID=UPI00143BA728|nr:ATP-binding protein [Thermococcus sp. LS2]NJE13755.1 ATP-binding protein [Thermococcus sp. LS2]